MQRFRAAISGQKRHVGKDNPPSFRKAGPCLALPAASELALDFPLEGYGDAGEVLAKGDDLEPL